MSLKNVVKVMNFHSLLRVDRSRKSAKKYSQMEQMVLEMLDNILNDRNVLLDVKALQMDPEMPQLWILLGSDLGFCGNLNNLVRHAGQGAAGRPSAAGGGQSSALGAGQLFAGGAAGKPGAEVRTILIGRKLKSLQDENTLLYQTREDFEQDHQHIVDELSRGLRN